MKIIFLICCVFALPLVSRSQDSLPPFQSSKSRFQPIAQIGLLNGSKGVSADMHAIAGFNLKPIYIGVGAGLDYYRLRSIPLFASIRKDFGKLRKPAFAYANLGYSYDWLTDANRANYKVGVNSDFSGGLYYDIGLGGRLSTKSNQGFTLGAGYTVKQMRQVSSTTICPFVGPCFTNGDTYKYNLARLVIRAGWIF